MIRGKLLDVLFVACIVLLAATLTCAVITLLSGCPKPIPIPSAPGGPAAACSPTMTLPTANDVCNGLFHSSIWACVKCAEQGCVDVVDQVYCVVGSCLTDSNCHLSELKHTVK